MVITYHGAQFFKVSLGSLTLAFNPISKKSKLKGVKFGADLALVSLNHPDFNGVNEVTLGNRQPFLIKGPGEYEVGEVTVRGFGIPTTYNKKEYINTIYQVRLEGMNLLFLGALGDPEIDPKILGELGDIDVLFLPIGGDDLLSVPQASKLAAKLEARAIIPMHYDSKTLATFLEEESSENGKPAEKVALKRKDVSAMEGEIIVLES